MAKIIYPKPLSKQQSIGVTAPSSGLGNPTFVARFELIKSQFEKSGFTIVEGKCLRENFKHVSADATARAKDFVTMWNDSKIGALIPPWGGELLIEILPQIDFDALKQNPKWLLGYSDTSTLLFAITLKTSIATAHGSNFMDLIEDQEFGVKETHLRALCGSANFEFSQNSFSKFQTQWSKYETKLDAKFNLTEATEWKSLSGKAHEKMAGRLIGGCLDTLVHLLGTEFGDLPSFVRYYKQDGVILYLENCEFSPCHVARALWQMRLAGWFKDLRGMVFGRSAAKDATNPSALSYTEALKSVLGDLNIPVIIDADIGHRPPQFILINGALSEWELDSGRGKVKQAYR